MGKFRETLEGTGIGLLGGLLIGLSDADWLRLAIALALFAYTGSTRKNLIPETATDSYRKTFTGISAFVAVLAGLYLNGQQIFEKTPGEAVSALTEAGYTPSQAREIYKQQVENQMSATASPSPSINKIIDAYSRDTATDSLSANTKSTFPENDSIQIE
jgi:hypothetical protein